MRFGPSELKRFAGGLASALLALLGSCKAGPEPSPLGLFTESELVVEGSYRLHYESSGAGPDCLVVPGGSAIGPDLAPLAASRRLIWYDGRGEGRSDRVDDTDHFGFERDVEDLERLRQHLGLERMSLLGWSYHAGIAAHYASRYPEHTDRLVLVAPIPLQREPYWRRYRTAVSRRLGVEGRRALIDFRPTDTASDCEWISSVVLPLYFVDPAALDNMRGTACAAPNNDPDRVNTQRLAKLKRLGDWDWSGIAGEVEARALVVPGHPNLIHPRAAELWATAIPRSEFILLEGVGHYPWLEAPEVFFSLVESFLSDAVHE